MKVFRKLASMAALIGMLGATQQNLIAQNRACLREPEYVTGAGGYGYEQARRVPSLAPAIALGTIALVAIIAMALENSHHHGHSHSHSHD